MTMNVMCREAAASASGSRSAAARRAATLVSSQRRSLSSLRSHATWHAAGVESEPAAVGVAWPSWVPGAGKVSTAERGAENGSASTALASPADAPLSGFAQVRY